VFTNTATTIKIRTYLVLKLLNNPKFYEITFYKHNPSKLCSKKLRKTRPILY